MVEEKDYTKILPTEPPEGMIKFLYESGELRTDILIYKAAYVTEPLTGMKEKMVECVCTACGESFYQEYRRNDCCHSAYAPAPFGFTHSESNEDVISGNSTFCPWCGAEVGVYHVGNIRDGKNFDEVYPMSVHMIDGKLVIIGWCIYKYISKAGNVTIMKQPYEGYVFEGNKAVRLVGYRKTMNGGISFFRRWAQLKKCTDIWGKQESDLIYPWDGSILIGTHFENSKFDMYCENDGTLFPITYIRLWQRHKNIENLIMQGAGKLLNSIIANNSTYYGTYGYDQQRKHPTLQTLGIDWKKKRPSEMLGLNRVEFRIAVQKSWRMLDLEFYKEANKHGITIDDMAVCAKVGYERVRRLFAIDNNIMKTIRYLEKQTKKYPDAAQMINVRYIVDYWEMAAENGADITDPDIKYPQNLENAHNTALRKKKWKEDKKLIKLFAERHEQLQKFSYSNDMFEIQPAINEEALIIEGKILNHCVADYAKRHAKGDTAIFFIRQRENVGEPYYTLEFDEKSVKVLQNRGYKNRGKTPEVQAFEDEWLEFVKKVIQEEKENGKSDHTAA